MNILNVAILTGFIATILTVLFCLAKGKRNVPKVILRCIQSNLPIAAAYMLIRAAVMLFIWISEHALLCITLLLLPLAGILIVIVTCHASHDSTKTICRQHLKEAKRWHCRMCRENRRRMVDHMRAVEDASISVLNAYTQLIVMANAYQLADPTGKVIMAKLSQIDEAQKNVRKLWLQLLEHYASGVTDISAEVLTLIDALQDAITFTNEKTNVK